jgi:hypothetical protein
MSLPVQPISEKLYLDADGKSFHFVKRQNVQSILDAAKDAAETLRPNTGPVGSKYLGTVPVLIAQQWSKECGAAIGSREWAAYAKTKLKDGTWARLRVHQK